ncbi:MAG: hypothetical protein GY771_03485 [bacterium]|nr:hypothetical protein [bacterium]
MSTTARIRAELGAKTLVEMLGLNLVKAGRNLMLICPFHPDKNPSMLVGQDSNRFKCFGCGAYGDVI